jgi:hypothetical protein
MMPMNWSWFGSCPARVASYFCGHTNRLRGLSRHDNMAQPVRVDELFPVQPSPLDIWAAEDIVGLITEARIYCDHLQACFVINRRIANTVIGRHVRAACEGVPPPKCWRSPTPSRPTLYYTRSHDNTLHKAKEKDGRMSQKSITFKRPHRDAACGCLGRGPAKPAPAKRNASVGPNRPE